jgi:hypothetical protein
MLAPQWRREPARLRVRRALQARDGVSRPSPSYPREAQLAVRFQV